MDIIFDLIESTESTAEFQRLFHGRGESYLGLEFITIDSIDKILSVAFYSEPETGFETEFISRLKSTVDGKQWNCIVIQKRFLQGFPSEVIYGELPEEPFALENGLKYSLNLSANRNSGFFPDMLIGREFIRNQAKGKRVLNLFSYTCSFSVVAIAGGAEKVVNVDMSKGALSTGRKNHHLNDISTENVQFMPYNILKSWNRIKKAGPYDIIIIDPPTFQKGSFAASKDYVKIVRRLSELTAEKATVLAALNSPHHDCQFLKDIFAENAPELKFVKRLPNSPQFPSKDEERALKNLIYEKL